MQGENRIKYIKSEFVPILAMKAYRGIRGIAPLIFNLGAGWM
jgi:hypothetical protein